MKQEHNPQAEQMADESMARNLSYQAQATWPQEHSLFDRYSLSGAFETPPHYAVWHVPVVSGRKLGK